MTETSTPPEPPKTTSKAKPKAAPKANSKAAPKKARTPRPQRRRWEAPPEPLPPCKKQILINVGEEETRIAILEDDKLVEMWYERPEDIKMAGNIYKGTATSVFPGMQATFVEIGEARTAFLHVSDIGRAEGDEAELVDEPDSASELVRKEYRANIQDVVKKDQVMMVQVIKEPFGGKGARLTTAVSLPGRMVVLVPDDNHVRVSKRITNWTEKRRLKDILEPLRPDGCGLIARTEAEDADAKDFKKDIKDLVKKWKQVKKDAEKKAAPACLYRELDITGSMLRDIFTEEVERLVIDDRKLYREAMSFAKKIAPALKDRVEYYKGEVPIFDLYGIESEIEKMVERKVWFKRGSFLVIDQTEAMVTIDVNTGRYVGKKNQEDTILRANLQAAIEVARQVRLRDIGGLIVIDFIDMMHHSNRRRVYEEFRKAFGRDRAKNSIATISDYGLIEMTRQRIRPSIMITLSDPCPTCDGTGRVLSAETVAAKIERWFIRAHLASDVKKFRLVVHPKQADYFAQDKDARIKRIRKVSKCKIEVETDELLGPDKYRTFSVEDDVEFTDMFNPRGPK